MLAQQVGHAVDGLRVETAERLVEHEPLGPAHDRGDDLDPLLVAQRELLDVVPGPVGEPEALEVARTEAAGRGGRHAAEPTEVDELVEHRLLGIEAALLGHVAELAPVGRGDRAGLPSNTSPAVIDSTPITIRIVVVLPAPLPPTNPVSAPAAR